MSGSTRQEHTGFKTKLSGVLRGIFLPKYYDPEIAARLAMLDATHTLITLGDLIKRGDVTAATGDEIGKMAYGTGTIPFVRTSDVSNWEIKTDAKQGVSEEVYAEYGPTQDVQAGDIMFVRDGTYLIGQIALVTESDLPLLYQSHIVKFRVRPGSPISSTLLMACLSAPIVKRQIRSKQFTADIIDTIGDRWKELVLPVPRDSRISRRVADEVAALTTERSRLRDKIIKIPLRIQNDKARQVDEARVAEDHSVGFSRRSSAIHGSVFIPKYYDPSIQAELRSFQKNHRLTSIAQLVDVGVLSWDTGIEVGKMAYGTGEIPFIRTSDISNWELKGDPKQGVSEEIYESNRQDVKAGDIFVVRDGTYLVGTSCILTDNDTRILYCGGLYKLRVERIDELDPYLLLALLNTPIVRRQMRSKQFTRDIIDTLGKRLFEVLLPIPKDGGVMRGIAEETREVIEKRATMRDRTKAVAVELEGLGSHIEEEQDLVEEV
jgi:hypothetical protein